MKSWDYYGMFDVPRPSMSTYASKEEWRKAREEWVNIERKRYLEFKEDLFKEHGVENDPARELIFSKAWDTGHAYGYAEVYSEFEDLMDFVKAVREV